MSRDESPAEIVERLRWEREQKRKPLPCLEVGVVITGGRDYTPTREEMERFWKELDRIGATVVHHGGASGVDRFVAAQVRRHRPAVKVVEHAAQWDLYGRRAGPLRNREMVAEPGVVALLAFPGGSGTRSCEEEAARAGRAVVYCYDRPEPRQVEEHRHEVREWWWSSPRASWVGRCSRCRREVVADEDTAAGLERSLPA